MERDAKTFEMWWPGTELNRRRQPFQSSALPPELPGHVLKPALAGCEDPSLTLSVARFADRTKRLSAEASGTSSIITTVRISLNVRCSFVCREKTRSMDLTELNHARKQYPFASVASLIPRSFSRT